MTDSMSLLCLDYRFGKSAQKAAQLLKGLVRTGLPSVQDTEYIVAKAIRDGGIEAEIDHEHGWITSRATPNTYSTNDPQLAFHRRVAFCMDLHNEVRASRFPALVRSAAARLCTSLPAAFDVRVLLAGSQGHAL